MSFLLTLFYIFLFIFVFFFFFQLLFIYSSTSSKPLFLPESLSVCLPIPYSKCQGMASCYGNSLLGNLLAWRRAHRLPGQCCQWQQSAVPAVCDWMCIYNVFILFESIPVNYMYWVNMHLTMAMRLKMMQKNVFVKSITRRERRIESGNAVSLCTACGKSHETA